MMSPSVTLSMALRRGRHGTVPMNWTCPECGARKEDFELVQI